LSQEYKHKNLHKTAAAAAAADDDDDNDNNNYNNKEKLILKLYDGGFSGHFKVTYSYEDGNIPTYFPKYENHFL